MRAKPEKCFKWPLLSVPFATLSGRKRFGAMNSVRGHFRLKNEQNQFFDHASQKGWKSEVEHEHLPCQMTCDCRRKICRSGANAASLLFHAFQGSFGQERHILASSSLSELAL